MQDHKNLARKLRPARLHNKYLKKTEDCGNYKPASLLQPIDMESEFDSVVQWQTSAQVQMFPQYAHAIRLLVKLESIRLDSFSLRNNC